MICLHHALGSPHSASVRLALVEKGLAYEDRPVDLETFEQHAPAFLAVNSSGQVPVLADGDCRIVETFFILLYLDEAYPLPALGGATPQARYQVQKWGKYVETHIAPNLALLRWAAQGDAPHAIGTASLAALPHERRELWRKAASGFPDAELAAARQAIAKAGDRLAADLSTSPWLAGDASTLADIAVYPHAAHFRAVGIEPPATLDDWLGRMARRPSVTADAERDRAVATMGPERGRWG